MADNVFVVSGHTMNLGPKGGLTTITAGDWVPKGSPNAAIQVFVTGTGTVTATVLIEVSNGTVDNPDPTTSPSLPIVACDTPAATITLSGTTQDSDGFVTQNASWKFIRMRVTAISGTNATVTGTIGI